MSLPKEAYLIYYAQWPKAVKNLPPQSMWVTDQLVSENMPWSNDPSVKSDYYVPQNMPVVLFKNAYGKLFFAACGTRREYVNARPWENLIQNSEPMIPHLVLGRAPLVEHDF